MEQDFGDATFQRMSEADRLFVAHRNQVFRYLARLVGQVDASELTQ
jgi:DNA-directed RNA polymerase specialized sigma24 family protein